MCETYWGKQEKLVLFQNFAGNINFASVRYDAAAAAAADFGVRPNLQLNYNN